jgi:hypothetical protein
MASRAIPLLRRGLASTAAAASPKPATYEVPAAALASFRERGWAVLPRFLSEEEITREIEADYNRFMKGEVPMPAKDFMDMSQSFDASACAALREPARKRKRKRKRKRGAAARPPDAAQPLLGAATCRLPSQNVARRVAAGGSCAPVRWPRRPALA